MYNVGTRPILAEMRNQEVGVVSRNQPVSYAIPPQESPMSMNNLGTGPPSMIDLRNKKVVDVIPSHQNLPLNIHDESLDDNRWAAAASVQDSAAMRTYPPSLRNLPRPTETYKESNLPPTANAYCGNATGLLPTFPSLPKLQQVAAVVSVEVPPHRQVCQLHHGPYKQPIHVFEKSGGEFSVCTKLNNIASDLDGFIYISDETRVVRFGEGHSPKVVFKARKSIAGLAICKLKREIVCLTSDKKICVYDFKGKFQRSYVCKDELVSRDLVHVPIAVNSQGHIIVVDDIGAAVHIYDDTNGLLKTIKTEDTPLTSAWEPWFVAVAPDDSLLVSDGETGSVLVFDRGFKYLGKIGEDILVAPAGLAVDSRGNVLVSDSENMTVETFALTTGQHVATVANCENDILSKLSDVAVTQDGHVAVFQNDDGNQHCVKVYCY